MNVFDGHDPDVAEYSTYLKSFAHSDDAQIATFVHADLARDRLWPTPSFGPVPPSVRTAPSRTSRNVHALTRSGEAGPLRAG